MRNNVSVAVLAASVLGWRQCDSGICYEDWHNRRMCGSYQPYASWNTNHPLTWLQLTAFLPAVAGTSNDSAAAGSRSQRHASV